MLRLTQLFNITGHPALAIPAGRGRDGMPRGIQLVSHRTARLLALGLEVERAISRAGQGQSAAAPDGHRAAPAHPARLQVSDGLRPADV
jgi:Asp-tRNA(Asn)/Glu-tRNA(Gln) amidotransferase A subunit family amidase